MRVYLRECACSSAAERMDERRKAMKRVQIMLCHPYQDRPLSRVLVGAVPVLHQASSVSKRSWSEEKINHHISTMNQTEAFAYRQANTVAPRTHSCLIMVAL